MSDKIFINGVYCKASKYGVKMTGKAETIAAEIIKHANSKGYINLEMLAKKQVDEKGNSHYIIVDQWEPGEKAAPVAKSETFGGGGDLPF